MILDTLEKFQNAILSGEEIKHETVFYTGELENQEMPLWNIGSFDKEHGVYAGMCNNKQVWVQLGDADEAMKWEEAKEYCEDLGYHLPTKEELMLIYANKDIINKALEEHGGEPLKDKYYWSSSELSNGYAWRQYLSDGGTGNFNKSGNRYVRPVLAF